MSSSTSSSEARRLGLLYGAVLPALLGLYLWASPRALRAAFGPSTAEQVSYGFRVLVAHSPFDAVCFGNSRIYRGLDPSRFPRGGFNFAMEGETPQQVYYKLAFLDLHGKLPRAAVIGIDYFDFSQLGIERLDAYRAYFPKQFARDFAPDGARWGQLWNDRLNFWVDRHFSQALPVLLAGSHGHRELTAAGQYRVDDPGRTTPYSRPSYVPVHRSARRLPLLESYFERSLQLCRDRHVAVLLVMPPLNAYELNAYTPAERSDFWSYIERVRGQAVVDDLSRERDFTLRDYADFTHLRQEASERFSGRVAERLTGPESRGGDRPEQRRRRDAGRGL